MKTATAKTSIADNTASQSAITEFIKNPASAVGRDWLMLVEAEADIDNITVVKEIEKSICDKAGEIFGVWLSDFENVVFCRRMLAKLHPANFTSEFVSSNIEANAINSMIAELRECGYSEAKKLSLAFCYVFAMAAGNDNSAERFSADYAKEGF